MANKKPSDYGSRDAGAIIQTGKTQHGDSSKGKKGPGGGGGTKSTKSKTNKGGSYGTGPAKSGY